MTMEWRARFGPFRLSPAERLLEKDGVPVRLGGRALDLLIALVDAAGEIVAKKELLARVWPNMVVEEGALRYHIVAIRKALADGGDERYVVNVANQGYSFVAPVVKSGVEAPPPPAAPVSAARLPALPAVVLGRDGEIDALAAALARYRLVSVVGTGGIGKTTLAIAALHSVYPQFGGDVHFVDFSCVAQAELVPATVGRAIGMTHVDGAGRALQAQLADRTLLLVLDCCEHLIDAVAALVEDIMRSCPGVRFLVTSREVLRVVGEYVHRLQPLAFPADGEGLTAAAALAYPAVRLFVERAAAGGVGFALTDDDAPLVSRLCRQLDGIALAIELAASRIEALGLHAVTRHLADAALLWPGRRTANARHQTLRATLDWSFNLLPDDEKALLRRLAVFAGTFSLEAALAVCCPGRDQVGAMELLANLVSKSLVSVDAGGPAPRYRLLDTTKSYCRAMLEASAEHDAVAQRCADFFHDWIVLDAPPPDRIEADLPNLRAALDRYLSAGAQPARALDLAAAACPLLLQCSQLVECARWAQAVLQHLPPAQAGSPLEMRVQGALGQALMFLGSGHSGRATEAFRRSIDLAQRLDDPQAELHLLNGYLVLLHREGAYTRALDVAYQAQGLLARLDDPQSRFTVDSLMGVCLHMTGRIAEAARHWDNCFSYTKAAPHVLESKTGFEYHIRALCGRSRTLWLTGHHAQAFALADETIALAKRRGHAVTYCIALIWAGSVYSAARDVERIAGVAHELERVGRLHSLEPYRQVAAILDGQILILQGQPAAGCERLRTAVDALHGYGYEMVTSVALTLMARGLSDLSLHAAALAMCDEAEAMIRGGGDLLRLPDFLATRGYCLVRVDRAADAERSFLAAMALAREQGAWSHELRAAVALAELRVAQGRAPEAASLLRPLVGTHADDVPDVRRARTLLEAA